MKSKTNMLLKYKNLKEKRYYSQQTVLAQLRNPVRCHLPAPAWARSPAADGWAGQAAQLLNPPGLKVAHAATKRPPPSICRSTAEIHPAENGAVYKPELPGNLRAIPIFLFHSQHNTAPAAAVLPRAGGSAGGGEWR
jgi:hypothetical protein